MTAFRAVVWKEARENLKVAAAAFGIVSVGWLLVLSLDRSVASSGLSNGGPSISISMFTFTSALVALMIGRSMIIRERRGDAWAFLTHRPVQRSTLFWAKALVGALLYLVAAGVPMTLALLWQATPGHRPMPFDWRMTLPDVADLLCGLVYLGAALVVTMRTARWYASRYLPIGAAIFCSTAVASVQTFSMAAGIVTLGLLGIGMAARGLFIAGGEYAAESRWNRAMLGVTIGIGLTIAGSVVLGILNLVMTFGTPGATTVRTTDYELTSDGQVVQMTTVRRPLVASTQVVDVRDLAGHALPQYHDSASRGASLQAGVISTTAIPINPSGDYSAFAAGLGYRGTGDLFVQLSQPTVAPSAVSWFFIRRLGLVAAYDNPSARLIGWMGPDGFSAGPAQPSHRFVGALDRYTELGYKQPLLAFPSAVYRLDLSHRSITKVYRAQPGEVVVGAAGSGDSTAALPQYGPNAQFDAIATTTSVRVQSFAGQPEITTPRDPRANGYGELVVSRAVRAPGAPTVLRYSPKYGTLANAQREAATDQIDMVGANDLLVAQYTLPRDTTATDDGPDWPTLAVTALTTPLVGRITASLYSRLTKATSGRARTLRAPLIVGWTLTILAALMSAALAFGIARTYAFESDRVWLWTTLGLALGGLGVLLMLALIEWPPREACPSCGRKRVVSREQCEHCGAAFGAPAIDGTEIFEPAA
ncbi:MAG TPA: ABC transporter permease [Gemmatimonadaceae bacterium]|jgi:hypothetical protein